MLDVRKCIISSLAVVLFVTVFRSLLPLRLTEAIPPQDALDSTDDPVGRAVPLTIVPQSHGGYEVPEVVLSSLLSVAKPRWHPPTVPIMLHAVRLWGRDAVFEESPPDQSSGRFIEVLLDSRQCDKVVGQFSGFLVATDHGVRVLSSGDMLRRSLYAEPHSDKLLQVLAECAVSRDTPVIDNNGRRHTVEAILRESLWRFSLSQELEFTTNAYTLWLPPRRTWSNRFGQVYSFSDLAEALVSRPIGSGACQGTHVPYALNSLIRANELAPELLSQEAEAAAYDRLRTMSVRLELNELPGGGWDKTWSGEYVAVPENMFFEFKPHFDRIAVTGHHLEWIALAPEELRPSRNVVQRAIEALGRELSALSGDDLQKSKGYLPVTHAVRAMVLLSGKRFASDIDSSGVAKGGPIEHPLLTPQTSILVSPAH
jgi:hypothetical protein